MKGKRSNCNITPLLHLKLRRGITYERCKSEVSERRDRGAGHVGDGNIVILEVFQGRMRTRRGMGVGVVAMKDGVFRDHPAGMRGRNRVRLRRGQRRGRRCSGRVMV